MEAGVITVEENEDREALDYESIQEQRNSELMALLDEEIKKLKP